VLDLSTKQASGEFDERQREPAAAAGTAHQRSLWHTTDTVAHTEAMIRRGEHTAVFAREGAEGLCRLTKDGESEREAPDDGNCHRDVAADGHWVPELSVRAPLPVADGESVSSEPLWHPGRYHHGRTRHLPDDGSYDIETGVEPPTFHRHGRTATVQGGRHRPVRRRLHGNRTVLSRLTDSNRLGGSE